MTLLTGLQYRIPVNKLGNALYSYAFQWGEWKDIPVGTESFSGPVQLRPEPYFQAKLTTPNRGFTNYKSKDTLMAEIARRLDNKEHVAVTDIKTSDFEYATARIQFRQFSGASQTAWEDLGSSAQISERVDKTEFRKKPDHRFIVTYQTDETIAKKQVTFDDLGSMSQFLSDKVKAPEFYKIEIHREKNV
jgi:hypothetical protein